MTHTQQPEALRLAEMLTADEWPGSVTLVSYARECVAELLRQHARIAELEDGSDMAIKRIAELESQLSAIGAGGVEPLRNREASAALAAPDERKAFDAANLRDYFGGPLSYRERDIAFMAWQARAALAATQPSAQGWKLVPVEPTEKMISEGGCAQTLKDGHRYIGECAAKTAWSFMLAAAPQPPACNLFSPGPQ